MSFRKRLFGKSNKENQATVPQPPSQQLNDSPPSPYPPPSGSLPSDATDGPGWKDRVVRMFVSTCLAFFLVYAFLHAQAEARLRELTPDSFPAEASTNVAVLEDAEYEFPTPDGEDDNFNFGKVVSVDGDNFVLREYDFVKDTDVETVYSVTPETEYGNIRDSGDIFPGDDVVVDFLMEDDRRVITTLVREEKAKSPNQALEETITLKQVRRESLELYKRSDYAEARELLEQLLAVDFEVSSTRLHLARIAFVTDDYLAAREHVAQALEHRFEAAPYVVPRILWFQTAFALLDGDSPAPFLARLKTALEPEDAIMEWDMDPVLAYLKPRLCDDAHALLTALVAALSDREDIAKLDAFPEWSYTVPQPLE